MNMYMPVNIYWGSGTLRKNAAELKRLGSRCLILTTNGLSAKLSGALNDAEAALRACNIEYAVFAEIGQNPPVSVCCEAGKIARTFGTDFIFAVGGGSVLDASKAAAVFAANPELAPMDIYSRRYNSAHLPIAAVGTTSGTGSEVTGVSVLTVDSTGRKKSISGPDCYISLVFADPMYTATMPMSVTVSTALDSFSHSAESWFNSKLNPFLEAVARQSLPMVWNGLSMLSEGFEPDEKMREKLYYASLLSGLIINTCGTAFPHPLGYVLTEEYGVPHGQACAAFLPAFFDRARIYAPEKSENFFTLLGEDLNGVLTVLHKLSTTEDIVITPAEAQKYAQRWRETQPKNFAASPGGFTPEEAAQVLSRFAG